MNPPNVSPLTRTNDAGLNVARELWPDEPGVQALAAVLMNRGLVPIEDIVAMVARARALPQ